jgi:hypothetical protein
MSGILPVLATKSGDFDRPAVNQSRLFPHTLPGEFDQAAQEVDEGDAFGF